MTGRRTRPGEEETTGGEGRGEGRLEEGTGRERQTDRRTRENSREKKRTGGAAEGVADRGAGEEGETERGDGDRRTKSHIREGQTQRQGERDGGGEKGGNGPEEKGEDGGRKVERKR